MSRSIVRDRLSITIERALFRDAKVERADRHLAMDVYDAVVALAKVEAAEHDQALDAVKGQLELAWRTARREAPSYAAKHRSLAGIIVALVQELQATIDQFNRRGAELTAQDNEIEHLKLDVRQAEENYEIQRQRADKLQKELARYERPGFQVILESIRKRQNSAKEQSDRETDRKLEVLWQAADATLLPQGGKPTVRIEFTWPKMVGWPYELGPAVTVEEFTRLFGYRQAGEEGRETGPPA